VKTKNCALCNEAEIVLFRIQIKQDKNWIFVCKTCCEKMKKLEHYNYGGTWKGKRH
jgi:hypothetical protein